MQNPGKRGWQRLLTPRHADAALLFMRLFIGAMMLTHGIGKIQNYNAIVNAFPDPFHLGSAVSFTLITLVEVGCSALVIIGFLMRLALLPLIFGMLVATFIAFPDKSFAAGELSFLYMGVYVMLFIAGPGRYALDALCFPVRRSS